MKMFVVVAAMCAGVALSEPLSLSPPMGWRSWNALGHDHGEVPTQAALTETMAALINRSDTRTVDGIYIRFDDVTHCNIVVAAD